jgi:flagellar protein FlaG
MSPLITPTAATAPVTLRATDASPALPEPRAATAPAAAPVQPTEQAALQAQSAQRAEDQREDREATLKAVAEANSRIAKSSSASIRFEVHEGTGDLIIQVVDEETDELIRQLPPEELLRVSESLADLRGILLDRQG